MFKIERYRNGAVKSIEVGITWEWLVKLLRKMKPARRQPWETLEG